MSIDKANRSRIADAIERYIRCEIDNFELDDLLQQAEDRAAFEISSQVWYFYCDVKRHKNEARHKLTAEADALLKRWMLFLRSDHEWPIDEPDRRTGWHKSKGVLKPLGCLFQLILLPIMLFQIIALGHPRPRFTKNEYWPFESSEDWKRFSSATGSG